MENPCSQFSKLRNLALVLLIIFGITGCKTQEGLDSLKVPELNISDIHSAYRLGNFNAESLTKAYLERIAALDGEFNSITQINPEAVSRAKELDLEYQRTGNLRPLHGIPIIIKDNINTIGLPTTAGSLALQDFYPEENAFVIDKLLEAGAILLAKSNMAEWAFSPMHTESTLGGITRNPYNTDFVPAGSSGGTAAAIAANFAVGGLGTDTGNSIRGPSSHTSLVGFRSTMGLISREGIVPLYLRNDVVGPMTRTVEDATRIMEVMAGVDPKDPVTKNSENKKPANYTQYLIEDGLKGARIGVLRELSDHQTDPEVKALFEKAISDLDSLGAEIIDPVTIPDFKTLRQNQWCATFRKDVESFLITYVERDTIKSLEDLIRIGTTSQFAKDRLSESSTASGRWGDPEVDCLDIYHDTYSVAFREAIESAMDSLNLDAIIYPTWNNKPAQIDNFQKEYEGDNSQVIAPHTGQPAFTVPMGYTSGNLPAGLQFLGRMYAEPILIKLSYSYEQGTKHRKPPKLKN